MWLSPTFVAPRNMTCTVSAESAIIVPSSRPAGPTAQAYPDIVGIGTHPAQTGAALVNALSAPGGGPPDAVYHVREIFPHTGATLAIEMQAPLLSAAVGASWGVDNVEVMLDAPVGFTTETTGGVTIVPSAPRTARRSRPPAGPRPARRRRFDTAPPATRPAPILGPATAETTSSPAAEATPCRRCRRR